MAHRQLALLLGALVAAMLGISFAAEPLYNTFCRVTGFGGTTRIATAAPEYVSPRSVEVRFDANVSDAPILFRPLQNSLDIQLGQHGLAFYEATNTASHPVSVIASYNVTPHKAGPYFNKLECFCFTERVFQPGETKKLPVVFFVSPDLEEKRLLSDVQSITLSYTFFSTETWKGATKQASLD